MEDDLDQEGVHNPSAQLPELKFDQKRASNSVTQFDLLCRAFFRMYWRTPTYNLTRLMISVALACVFAIIYQSTDYSTYSGANAAIGLIFVNTVFMDIINFSSVMLVAADGCTAFYRERASQTYNALWYVIAGTLVEIPYIFLSSLLFTVIFYLSVGFTPYNTFFYYWLVVSLRTCLRLSRPALGVRFAECCRCYDTFAHLSSIFMLFAGFNHPTGFIPDGYMWVHWISPPTYSIAILVRQSLAITRVIRWSTMRCKAPHDMTLKQYVEEILT